MFLGDIIYVGLGNELLGFRLNEQGTKKGKVYTLSVSQSMFIYLKPSLGNQPDNEDSERSGMRFLSSRTSWSKTGGTVQGNLCPLARQYNKQYGE